MEFKFQVVIKGSMEAESKEEVEEELSFAFDGWE